MAARSFARFALSDMHSVLQYKGPSFLPEALAFAAPSNLKKLTFSAHDTGNLRLTRLPIPVDDKIWFVCLAEPDRSKCAWCATRRALV
jgi:hypothetical protein